MDAVLVAVAAERQLGGEPRPLDARDVADGLQHTLEERLRPGRATRRRHLHRHHLARVEAGREGEQALEAAHQES